MSSQFGKAINIVVPKDPRYRLTVYHNTELNEYVAVVRYNPGESNDTRILSEYYCDSREEAYSTGTLTLDHCVRNGLTHISDEF